MGDGILGRRRSMCRGLAGRESMCAWGPSRESSLAGARTEQQKRGLGRGQWLVTKGFGRSEMGWPRRSAGLGERSSAFGCVEMSVGGWINGSEFRRESQLGDYLDTVSLWIATEAPEAEEIAL